jgi:ethanolamine-phosphate cytidylyltransferase
LKRLEAAKKLGDFLYVGIWDDEMTSFYKGQNYPIVHLQERVLMTLACKHVDDVVIGSPYILTEDLIKSLNIKKVVQIIDTDED